MGEKSLWHLAWLTVCLGQFIIDILQSLTKYEYLDLFLGLSLCYYIHTPPHTHTYRHTFLLSILWLLMIKHIYHLFIIYSLLSPIWFLIYHISHYKSCIYWQYIYMSSIYMSFTCVIYNLSSFIYLASIYHLSIFYTRSSIISIIYYFSYISSIYLSSIIFLAILDLVHYIL